MSEWKIVWREIGWKRMPIMLYDTIVPPEIINTIRNGWAAEYNKNNCSTPIYAWIECGNLAIREPIDYYPCGEYSVPLNIIKELIKKNEV